MVFLRFRIVVVDLVGFRCFSLSFSLFFSMQCRLYNLPECIVVIYLNMCVYIHYFLLLVNPFFNKIITLFSNPSCYYYIILQRDFGHLYFGIIFEDELFFCIFLFLLYNKLDTNSIIFAFLIVTISISIKKERGNPQKCFIVIYNKDSDFLLKFLLYIVVTLLISILLTFHIT